MKAFISTTAQAKSPSDVPSLNTAGWSVAGAVLVLYVLIAIAVMAPLGSRALPESAADDLANHVSGIIEAGNALREGQFPIRVAPHQNDNTRYPIFQFYGNLPYTVGGALYCTTKLSPYTA